MHNSTLRNIWLVARREYLQHVRTKAFIFGLVITPLLMGGLMILPAKLMMRSGGEPKKIVLVASSAESGQPIQRQLESGLVPRERDNAPRGFERGPRSASMNVTLRTDATEATRNELMAKVDKKEIDGFLWADDASLASRKVSYFSRESTDFMLNGMIQGAITMAVMKHRLAAKGFSPEESEQLFKDVKIDAVRVDRGQTSRVNFASVFLGAITMMMILYMMVLMQGITVMRAVLEEKTSRVMEVLLSTCSSMELMAGKIIGVGAVGMTQIAIWVLAGTVLMAPLGLAASSAFGGFKLSIPLLVYFVIYYVLGYLTYSAIYAALGASCNSEQEAQSLQFIAMLPLILSTVLMMLVVRQPGSPLAVGFSLFPLTAPLIMFLRITIQMPPMWQIAVSIGLLILGIIGLMWVAARIYRIGILMYGKRPTLPEILKWVRYA